MTWPRKTWEPSASLSLTARSGCPCSHRTTRAHNRKQTWPPCSCKTWECPITTVRRHHTSHPSCLPLLPCWSVGPPPTQQAPQVRREARKPRQTERVHPGPSWADICPHAIPARIQPATRYFWGSATPPRDKSLVRCNSYHALLVLCRNSNYFLLPPWVRPFALPTHTSRHLLSFTWMWQEITWMYLRFRVKHWPNHSRDWNLGFVHFLKLKKRATFRKLDLPPSSSGAGKGRIHLVGPLEGASLYQKGLGHKISSF